MEQALNSSADHGSIDPGSQAAPVNNSWWDAIKMLSRNPYAHPTCGAVFGIAGANIMTPALHHAMSAVLPYSAEAAAICATCIAGASVARSGVTFAKDSFEVSKILAVKAKERYAEHQANKELPHSAVTLAGFAAATAAGGMAIGKTIKEIAKKLSDPIAEGYQNSRDEQVFCKETLQLSKASFCEFVAGGPNGEKAARNAMKMFTGLAAKVTGTKTAGAATVIAIFASQSAGPLGYAAACSAVGAFVFGAAAASMHVARERLEKGGNTEGAILTGSLEMASILGSAGVVAAAAVTPKIGGAVGTVFENAAHAYNSHPAVQEIVEKAREYVHRSVDAGLDRARAVELFMTTHALSLEKAHELASESVARAVEATKSVGEIVIKHTVESPIMETKAGEIAKEKLQELVREKIEEKVEHGAEIKEKPAPGIMLLKKFGAAFGKLVDLGPRAVEYLANDVPSLALSAPHRPAIQGRQVRTGPMGYGVGSLSSSGADSTHQAKKRSIP